MVDNFSNRSKTTDVPYEVLVNVSSDDKADSTTVQIGKDEDDDMSFLLDCFYAQFASNSYPSDRRRQYSSNSACSDFVPGARSLSVSVSRFPFPLLVSCFLQQFHYHLLQMM
mmetsp:Transcript_29596/g.71542  ORF Transcript_29596/g.71542 Transcript_29596/m.71542 type:complete len:112 (-) Transcript_29596:78-413(-)